MKFTVPEGYSVAHKGQVIQSKGGVIETDDKALIEHLSKFQKAEPKRSKPSKKDED